MALTFQETIRVSKFIGENFWGDPQYSAPETIQGVTADKASVTLYSSVPVIDDSYLKALAIDEEGNRFFIESYDINKDEQGTVLGYQFVLKKEGT
ncbi:hypothetical protein ACFO26_06880 [Lactococcus nasutitermitis]|uniref:Uncharacterized protein n=1 Tax=Lactococcus nasutitermitis TaxID=1652957 RepID=A0ABV9JDS3_9LACT|nr:hypothetical protein [Lactococcus nasutitermitis]